MSPFEVRLNNERTELAERTKKLGDFIGTTAFLTLDDIQRGLLIAQYNLMSAYLGVLIQRIQHLQLRGESDEASETG